MLIHIGIFVTLCFVVHLNAIKGAYLAKIQPFSTYTLWNLYI